MLRSANDFAAVGRSDVVRSDSRISARFLRTEQAGTRFGISTSRRLGGAVVRNRIRRRIRECLRDLTPRILPCFDILLVARQGSVTASQVELATTLERPAAGVSSSQGARRRSPAGADQRDGDPRAGEAREADRPAHSPASRPLHPSARALQVMLIARALGAAERLAVAAQRGAVAQRAQGESASMRRPSPSAPRFRAWPPHSRAQLRSHVARQP